MLILADMTGNIVIQNESGKITLSQAEAWDVLEYLHDQHKLELYQASKQAPVSTFQENVEPTFDDYCPYCAAHGIKAAHLLGTTEHCPHNPARFGWMKKREPHR